MRSEDNKLEKGDTGREWKLIQMELTNGPDKSQKYEIIICGLHICRTPMCKFFVRHIAIYYSKETNWDVPEKLNVIRMQLWKEQCTIGYTAFKVVVCSHMYSKTVTKY